MKKNILSILILTIYGFPFSFISMYIDFKYGSMIGYGIMITSYVGLVYICKLVKFKNIILLGNLISSIISFVCVSNTPYEIWGYYFNPLTPIKLLILICILAILLQLFIIYLINKKLYLD